jgi:hypothetical protein
MMDLIPVGGEQAKAIQEASKAFQGFVRCGQTSKMRTVLATTTAGSSPRFSTKR